MKRIALFAAMAVIIGIADAEALTRGSLSPYISGKVGYAHTGIINGDTSLNGVGLHGAFGAIFQANQYVAVRQELDLSYSPQWGDSSNSGDAFYAPWAGMANMYLDFGDCNIRPYIGAGLGVAEVHLRWRDSFGDLYRYDHSAFNWGLYAGLNIDVTRDLVADLGLRYNRAEVIGHPGEFQTFSATLGLRYLF